MLTACAPLDRTDIVPPFLKLLRDSEAEVRVAAAGKVACVGNILEADTVGSQAADSACSSFAPQPHACSHPRLLQVIRLVLPCVKVLAADSSQYVRSALAAVVMELAPTLGKAATIEHLLPVFLSLLKDDVPDVRLNIISKLDQVLSC